MTPEDLLKEYKEILKTTLEALHEVRDGTREAVRSLNKERRKYEDVNNKSWAEKHKTLLLASLPLVALLLIFAGAFIFVSSGHTINIRAGDYQVEAR